MKNRILITGGGGFIGFNIANHYLHEKYPVTILDNFSRKGSRENVKYLLEVHKGKAQIIEADILKDKEILPRLVSNHDVIFHLASQVAVTTSIKHPMQDFNINLLGTMNLLEAIRYSNNHPILLFSSTNKVYGDLNDLGIIEDRTRYRFKDFPYGISEKQNLNFTSPYGCSKGAADQYVHDYYRIYGLRTIVFRQSCIYGPHQFGIEDQGWLAWFIIALLMGEKITIYGNGKQVRDLLYIDDLTRAFDLAIQQIDKTNGKIYNIGGGSNNSISIWLELKSTLERLFQKEIIAEFAKERPGDQKIFIADVNKAKTDFGWEPEVSIDRGINKLFVWAKENKKMLRAYFH